MWCITTFKAEISHTNDSLGPEMIRYIWKKTVVMGKAGPSDLCFPQSIVILFLFNDTHSSCLMKNFPLWASVRTMHQNDACVHIWVHTGVLGLPWWLSRWSPPANAGDTGDVHSILGSGRSPGEENGNPLQYSHLKNGMGRGVGWATVYRVSKSGTQLSNQAHSTEIRTSLQSCTLFFSKSCW